MIFPDRRMTLDGLVTVADQMVQDAQSTRLNRRLARWLPGNCPQGRGYQPISRRAEAGASSRSHLRLAVFLERLLLLLLLLLDYWANVLERGGMLVRQGKTTEPRMLKPRGSFFLWFGRQ
jgi:hypothetical protein